MVRTKDDDRRAHFTKGTMDWMDSSDEEFINDIVEETMRAKEKAADINQPKECGACNEKSVVHRTCGSCSKVRCKDCVKHWQCPGCDRWYCEEECCEGGEGAGLYYCGESCGVICEDCLPWLYEDFTLMDTCCEGCRERIPKVYEQIKRKEKKDG